MAIVVYKCDVCKREIELKRNIKGIERIQRCTITHGCRGKMYQTKVLTDFIRGNLPDDVSGLDNWLQRKMLHNHTQPIERDTWTIVHNLGTFPSVSVYVDRPIEGNLDNQEEITPQDVIIVDPNTLKLVFDRPWSGVAQVVARQSDPNLLNPIVTQAEQVVPPQQLSTGGEITIATRISSVGESPTINLQLTFTTTQGSEPIVVYAADDQPAITSPWSDVDRVIIKGKIYTVRSFNVVVPEMTSGVIGNGSTFILTGIDVNDDGNMRSIQNDEVLVLLASEPYDAVDKITNQYINVSSVTPTTNPFAFYYDAGDFHSLPDVISNTYPPIRSA